VLLAFPAVLLAVVIMALLGPSTTNVMIAIGIAYIPLFARVVRGTVLSLNLVGDGLSDALDPRLS
jgi:peptide/nickel transport system permease protein